MISDFIMFERRAIRSPCESCKRHLKHIARLDELKTNQERNVRSGKNEDACRDCKERIAYLKYLDQLCGTQTRTETFCYHKVSKPSPPIPPPSEWIPIPVSGNSKHNHGAP